MELREECPRNVSEEELDGPTLDRNKLIIKRGRYPEFCEDTGGARYFHTIEQIDPSPESNPRILMRGYLITGRVDGKETIRQEWGFVNAERPDGFYFVNLRDKLIQAGMWHGATA
ncbi:MAG: hypothetical protein WC796_01240 [Candidatus Pacearchaeota archaeon]|jgi:hypothetical protein